MAKRVREGEPEPSQVVTEDRAAKRQATGGDGPKNFQYAPGWDPLNPGAAATKQQFAAAPLVAHPLAEPLRPANHAAAAGEAHSWQPQQAPFNPAQQHAHHPQQAAAQQQQLQQEAVAVEARSAVAEMRFQVDIDWRDPEAVAQLLRMLHVERLRRLGLQLPAELQQHLLHKQ